MTDNRGETMKVLRQIQWILHTSNRQVQEDVQRSHRVIHKHQCEQTLKDQDQRDEGYLGSTQQMVLISPIHHVEMKDGLRKELQWGAFCHLVQQFLPCSLDDC